MKQLVIMPGGFHPFHAGHLALYQSALAAFPDADVKVAATNDTSARPFPFKLKEKLAQLAGVPPGDFYQVKSPFQAQEITQKYNPADTQLIFVRSEKDADKPPRPGGIKKDGNPGYLQPISNQMAPMTQHAYMAYLPTVTFGPGMQSATEIRTAWPELDERRRMALVMSLYPNTQKNTKLANTVVKMLDTAMGTQEVDEDLSRRGFLKGAGAAAVAGVANDSEAGPWITNSQQDPMDNSTSKSNTIKSTDGSAYLKVNDNKSVSFFVTNNIMLQVSEFTSYGPALEYRIKIGNDLRADTGYVFGVKRSGFILTLGGEYSSELGNKLLNFNGIVKIEVPVYPDKRKIFEFEIGNLTKESIDQDVAEQVTRQMSQGGLRASYQSKYNQPMMEDYLDEARS